jgi:hypothetical protein
MYMQNRLLLATLAIALLPTSWAAQPEVVPAETVGEFLVHSRDENIAPFVKYCATTLPQLKESIDMDYQAFSVRLAEAAKELRQRLSGRDYLNAPMPTDLAGGARSIFEFRLKQVKTQDSASYCQGLRTNIASWTIEALVKNFEEQFVRFEAIASLDSARGKSR